MAKKSKTKTKTKTKTNTKTKTKKIPTPQQLKWSIDGRQQTQICTLRLYRVFLERDLSRLEHGSYVARTLASVSFSLWRAVFLADRTASVEEKNEHAQAFLAKMLTDNAITFAVDRDAREWSYVYYVQAAFSFLKRANVYIKPERPIKLTGSTTHRWEVLQEAFEHGVRWLEKSAPIKSKETTKNG